MGDLERKLQDARTLGAIDERTKNIEKKVDDSTARIEKRLDEMASSFVTKSESSQLKWFLGITLPMLGAAFVGLLLYVLSIR